MILEGSRTEKNLLSTFAGESRARNFYTLFNEKAKQEGKQFVALVFDETARNELAHARRVFNDFLGLNCSTLQNLLNSASNENEEFSVIYKEFEKVAREEGFNEIADFYKEVAEVEESHRNRFNKVAKLIEDGMLYKSESIIKWQCMNCGYIHIGKGAPKDCPLCYYPQGYFKRYCEDYK